MWLAFPFFICSSAHLKFPMANGLCGGLTNIVRTRTHAVRGTSYTTDKRARHTLKVDA